MAVPFAMRWEVSSLRSNHGSFVEAARVKALQGQAAGEWWVERPVSDLRPLHLARVQRRWWLASRLSSLAWPALIDAGEDGGVPWAVVQTPGRRTDGTFPFADPTLALKAARGLALGVAEAEALLAQHLVSPHVSVRPAMLACDDTGRLRFHLAALDPEPDLGFPSTPATWMWTAEELFGQPETARSNVFALAWLLTLMLTGRSPYGPVAAGSSEKAAKEALRPLVAQSKLALALPEALKPVEPVLRRALAGNAAQRFADAAAFAEALAPFAPGKPQARAVAPADVTVELPEPEPRFEALPAALEARLFTAGDESLAWQDLAQELARVRSPRAKLARGDLSVQPLLTPSLPGEQLTLAWKHGYVRALTTEPASRGHDASEARVLELTALMQHPSLRFLQDLTLDGPVEHAKTWLEVLRRAAPPGLRRVTVPGIAGNDPVAVEISFRFPKWTWTWGQFSGSSSLFRRLFGR